MHGVRQATKNKKYYEREFRERTEIFVSGDVVHRRGQRQESVGRQVDDEFGDREKLEGATRMAFVWLSFMLAQSLEVRISRRLWPDFVAYRLSDEV